MVMVTVLNQNVQEGFLLIDISIWHIVEAFGGIRGLRMGGLIQAIQEIVDGLGLRSEIGNQGTSVNKRLDPNAPMLDPDAQCLSVA